MTFEDQFRDGKLQYDINKDININNISFIIR